MSLLLTIDETAEELRMSPGYVRKEIREGRLRKVKLGTAVRVELAEIMRYIERQRVGETVVTLCHYTPPLDVRVRAEPLDSTTGDPS